MIQGPKFRVEKVGLDRRNFDRAVQSEQLFTSIFNRNLLLIRTQKSILRANDLTRISNFLTFFLGASGHLLFFWIEVSYLRGVPKFLSVFLKLLRQRVFPHNCLGLHSPSGVPHSEHSQTSKWSILDCISRLLQSVFPKFLSVFLKLLRQRVFPHNCLGLHSPSKVPHSEHFQISNSSILKHRTNTFFFFFRCNSHPARRNS